MKMSTNNTSNAPKELKTSLALAVTVGALGTATVLLNCLALAVFVKSKIQLTMKLLLGHLAFSDLAVGIQMLTLFFPIVLTEGFPYSDIWVQIFGGYQTFVLYWNMYSLGLVVFGRYLFICYPLKYEGWVTSKRIVCCIVFIWFFWALNVGVMFSVTTFYFDDRSLLITPVSNAFLAIHILLGPVVTFCLLACCYISILRCVHRLNRRVASSKLPETKVQRFNRKNNVSVKRTDILKKRNNHDNFISNISETVITRPTLFRGDIADTTMSTSDSSVFKINTGPEICNNTTDERVISDEVITIQENPRGFITSRKISDTTITRQGVSGATITRHGVSGAAITRQGVSDTSTTRHGISDTHIKRPIPNVLPTTILSDEISMALSTVPRTRLPNIFRNVNQSAGRSVVLTTLLICAFALSYVPSFVFVGMVASQSEGLEQCSVWAFVPGFLNNFLNVVMYSIAYQPFREGFLYTFCRKYWRQVKKRDHLGDARIHALAR